MPSIVTRVMVAIDIQITAKGRMMNKRDKLRVGKLKRVYTDRDEQMEGVFKTRESLAKPSNPPEFFIRFRYRGHPFYVYGFTRYEEAQRFYWEVIEALHASERFVAPVGSSVASRLRR